MRSKKNNIFLGIDWMLVLFYALFIFFGWINIYSATATESTSDLLSLSTEYGKQIIWIALSVPIILTILLFDAKFYERYASIFYAISMLSLIGLFVLGKNINGATSWYGLGSFSIQPSEFAKAATALAVAKLVSDKQFNLNKLNSQMQTFIVLLIPAILITLQPDPGSALVYAAFIFVLYREGLPFYYISIGFAAILLFVLSVYFGLIYTAIGLTALYLLVLIFIYFYQKKAIKKGWLKFVSVYAISLLFVFSVDFIFNNVFKQRHRDRFNIVLGKTSDTQNTGYNSDQSVITVASGRFTGKGFLQGERTQGDFVPENQTDYIFTIVGEEWGFLGSALVIVLFVLFCLRIIQISERQKSRFSRVYGYSIAAIFFVHVTINIGMVIGLIPTIGIPLPFFSYGGSALWGFTVLLFIFIRLDANRSYEY